MRWQRGIDRYSITNFIRQGWELEKHLSTGKKAKQTWSGKIIYLGDGFYVMVLFEE